MSENLHDIDKLFRDSIEGYEEAPSEKVWDTIDRKLDKSNMERTNRKYNNLRRLSVALLFLLFGVVLYEWQTRSYSGKNDSVSKNAATGNSDPLLPEQMAAGEKDKNQQPLNENGKNKLKRLKEEDVADNSGASEIDPSSEPAAKNADKIKDDLRPEETVRSANKKDQGSGKTGPKKKMYGPVDHTAEDRKSDDNQISSDRKKEYSAYKKSVLAQADEQNSVLAFQRPVLEKKNMGKDPYAENIEAITAVKQIMPFMSIAKATVPGDTRISPAGSINMDDLIFPQLQLPETGVSAIDLSKKKKPFHFSIMPFFSTQFNFSRIEDDDDHRGGGPGRRESEEIKRDEKHQASSSWGILVEAPLKKNWSLQTGLTYTVKNIDIEPKKIFAQLDNDGQVKYCFNLSSGYAYLSPKTTAQPVVGDSITAAETSSNLRYLGIPVTLQYTFFKGKFRIIPGIGGGINFLFSQRIKTNLLSGSSEEKQDISDIQGLKKAYYNTIAGIAVQYPIGKYVSLNIAPSVNFALGTINSNAAVKSYPNSFNIATGIRIQL